MGFGGVLVVIIIVAACIIGIYFLLRYAIREMTKFNDKAKELNAELHGSLKHMSGLPIPQNADVEMFICPTQYVFLGGNQEIAVAMNKVVSVDRVNGSGDPSKQMSDAAVGGLFLGAAGAMLGAISVGTTCLVVTYKSDDENKFIVLDGTKNTGFVKKAVKRFKQGYGNTIQPKKVEL